MDTINKTIAFLNGKKTYIVAIIAGLEAAAQALGYTIPPWVETLTAALGLGAIRHGMATKSN